MAVNCSPGANRSYAAHLAAIRRFFLERRETYSIEELAELWRVHQDDVRDVYHDEFRVPDAASRGIAWADAVGASIRFSMLRPIDVERALGLEFTRVRAENWRTVAIVIHLPKFITNALALQPSVPANLDIEVRVEQLVMELFVATGTRHDDDWVERQSR
jgi:hypothetical protein